MCFCQNARAVKMLLSILQSMILWIKRLFKWFLVRMDGSRHCALMIANVTKGDTTRHYVEHRITMKQSWQKSQNLNLLYLLLSKFQVSENAEDRGMLNCNMAMQLANPDNVKPFLQLINCKEKFEKEKERER